MVFQPFWKEWEKLVAYQSQTDQIKKKNTHQNLLEINHVIQSRGKQMTLKSITFLLVFGSHILYQ